LSLLRGKLSMISPSSEPPLNDAVKVYLFISNHPLIK
jgi:hypothetical protein